MPQRHESVATLSSHKQEVSTLIWWLAFPYIYCIEKGRNTHRKHSKTLKKAMCNSRKRIMLFLNLIGRFWRSQHISVRNLQKMRFWTLQVWSPCPFVVGMTRMEGRDDWWRMMTAYSWIGMKNIAVFPEICFTASISQHTPIDSLQRFGRILTSISKNTGFKQMQRYDLRCTSSGWCWWYW